MTARTDRPLIENHIHSQIGKIHTVFHEIVSDDIQLDVCHVKSGLFRRFELLVTLGMSAQPMNVPGEYNDPRFIELMMLLPKGWPLTQEDFNQESRYWPIRLLKDCARYAHHRNSHLGYGHTVAHAEEDNTLTPYAPGLGYCASIILPSITLGERSMVLKRGGRESDIYFFAVIPLFESELRHKMEHGTGALMDLFDQHKVTDVVNLSRESVISE